MNLLGISMLWDYITMRLAIFRQIVPVSDIMTHAQSASDLTLLT